MSEFVFRIIGALICMALIAGGVWCLGAEYERGSLGLVLYLVYFCAALAGSTIIGPSIHQEIKAKGDNQ